MYGTGYAPAPGATLSRSVPGTLKPKTTLVVTVRDTGCGMDAWVQKLEASRDQCLEDLGGGDRALEQYTTFLVYLRWATYLYKTGRSRCYICVWQKKAS